MDGSVEQPLALALSELAVAGILLDIGEQAGLEHARALVGGSRDAIEVERGASQISPLLFGHLLQGVQPLGSAVPTMVYPIASGLQSGLDRLGWMG